jgi:hypothetical protein
MVGGEIEPVARGIHRDRRRGTPGRAEGKACQRRSACRHGNALAIGGHHITMSERGVLTQRKRVRQLCVACQRRGLGGLARASVGDGVKRDLPCRAIGAEEEERMRCSVCGAEPDPRRQ